jgi:16S rRNA G966 N2-methylase RsmD
VESGFHVLHQDVIRGLASIEKQGVTANFVFLDPPYRLVEIYGKTLEALASSSAMNGVAVAEHEKRFDPGENAGGLVRYRKLVQGDTALSFYRRLPSIDG